MEDNYTLAKWLNNELEGDELKAFEASEEFADYQKIKEYSAQLKTPDFEEDKILKTVLSQKKKGQKVITSKKSRLFKIAAVLVLSIGITFAMRNFVSFSESALNGEKRSFVLPDNSEVVLNSGSEIQYKKWNWSTERKLKLDGEAFFKVAKGKTFEVETDLGKVTVLGTQFNVKSRNNRIDIICFEGKVKVNYNQEEEIITKGMSIAFEDGKKIAISNPTSSQPTWISNEISFSKEKLSTILEEISRQYNITVECKESPSNQDFSGTIPMDNLAVALEIITNTYHLKPVDSKINDKKIILESLND